VYVTCGGSNFKSAVLRIFIHDLPFSRVNVHKTLVKTTGCLNKKHLKFGAQVRPFYGTLSGSDIAEIYAYKMDQKKKPIGYSGVGRFWGCSNNLTEPAIVLSGLSEASVSKAREEAEELKLRSSDKRRAELARCDKKWCSTNTTGLESTGFIWDGEAAAPGTCLGIWSRRNLCNKLSIDEAVKRRFSGSYAHIKSSTDSDEYEHPYEDKGLDEVGTNNEVLRLKENSLEEQLQELEAWEELVSCARERTRESWRKQFGKPLVIPLRHAKYLVRKKQGSTVFQKKYVEVEYEENILDYVDRADLGDILEGMRRYGRDVPLAEAANVVDLRQWSLKSQASPWKDDT